MDSTIDTELDAPTDSDDIAWRYLEPPTVVPAHRGGRLTGAVRRSRGILP
jgi:hypothetical protein